MVVLLLLGLILVALVGHFGLMEGILLSAIVFSFVLILCGSSGAGSGTTAFFHSRRPIIPPRPSARDEDL